MAGGTEGKFCNRNQLTERKLSENSIHTKLKNATLPDIRLQICSLVPLYCVRRWQEMKNKFEIKVCEDGSTDTEKKVIGIGRKQKALFFFPSNFQENRFCGVWLGVDRLITQEKS